ncbi:sulfotransferase family 2 domain-containing protein [Methylomagnum ishizawai]|uniref:sulfotransferase family 2 domain-containing protein n=1 Tax=Methylomagnum ishizawai TaxID=1760988 RepID=UPI001C33C26D|nr:sulfotransferase family 2 domain-containing protein [Methylomagnum ishizawai]BBL75937.1 hypothetical protein MishRS11D_30350 [Methylomagnum ishizawai]
MAKRKVILHYHIFKNAGTSVDRMLEQSYGNCWLNYDKSESGEKISAFEMEAFILDHPDVVAFSSHQVVPPLPSSKFLKVFPIIVLRHPIDRAYSAYLFEWQKQQGNGIPIGKFSDYVAEKFQFFRKNAIEDFQTFHLANQDYCNTSAFLSEGLRKDEEALKSARQFIAQVGYFGIVDCYAESLKLFKKVLFADFPDLIFNEYHENMLQDKELTICDKVSYIRGLLDETSYTSLVMRNQLDLRLYEYSLGLFSKIYSAKIKGK